MTKQELKCINHLLIRSLVQSEIKAEVFKIIRANQEKTPRQIMKMIKDHLPNVDLETIRNCIVELSK